jgi:hypothetical protein
MEAVCSFFPEFNDLRSYPVAAPSIRTGGTRFLGERCGQLGHPLFEHRTPSDHLALVADHGAKASPQRP